MITTEHLTIVSDTTDLDMLHLAPFAEPEVAQYLPLPEAFTRYNPPSSYEGLDTAEAYLEDDREDDALVAWGIYVGTVATQNFVGTIGTSASNVGTPEEPERTRGVQNVHTGIVSAEWHGRSIGTVAKLAIAAYAFAEQNTHVLFAETSANNHAAAKSLRRCGFSPMELTKRYEFVDDSLTQSWMLADPLVQERMPDLQQTLQEGWQISQAAQANITVKNMAPAP